MAALTLERRRHHDVFADVDVDAVVVDRVRDLPMERARLLVGVVLVLLQPAVRDGSQRLRNCHPDIHATVRFVIAVILVRPPDARANTLARRRDERVALLILAPRETTAPWRARTLAGTAFVEHLHFVFSAGGDTLVQLHPIDVAFTFELHLAAAVHNARDLQWRLQIDLHAIATGQRLERDQVRTLDTLRLREDLERQRIVLHIPPLAFGRNRATQPILLGEALRQGRILCHNRGEQSGQHGGTQERPDSEVAHVKCCSGSTQNSNKRTGSRHSRDPTTQ